MDDALRHTSNACDEAKRAFNVFYGHFETIFHVSFTIELAIRLLEKSIAITFKLIK